MSAPDVVEQLVERFAGHEEGYTAPTYNETEARIEFIDPLFSALGWDVGNTRGAPPDLRDVIYEQTFKRNSAFQQPEEIIGKRPDYTFRVEQRPRFYVEAKKPAEDGRNNISKLPIRRVDFSNPIEKARHDDMVQLVESMLALHKQLKEANTPNVKSRIERRIEATDRQIDEMVYMLYRLTAEEVGIVEGSTKGGHQA